MSKLVVLLSLILLLGITSFVIFNRSQQGITQKTEEGEEEITVQNQKKDVPRFEVIARNLEVPWALAHLPDGSILITERRGTVRMIDVEGKLLPNPIARIGVKQTGESGLHGIALHPKYPKHPYVYLYYTYSSNNDNSLNRVSRFIFKDEQLLNEEIIVDQIPGAIVHDGGRIKFGPDSYLYITTGDAQNPSLSQDKNSLAGKILRMTDEGNPAPGNPFGTLIYSYGHRNPQGIAWDSQNKLWETEHGSNATDELNLIEPGKNYGWPDIVGDQTNPEMMTPKLQSGSSTWAPAGAAILRSSIFFAGLRGQTLYQVDLNSLQIKEHFKGQFGRIREVVLGADNLLYITTSNRDGRGDPQPDDDKIIRINPEKL